MIAVEEKDLQSVKTDASLYNGQPTDTGTQCHNVGVTSSTPSILKNKDGVSVESVHTHSKQVCIEGIIRKAKEIIDVMPRCVINRLRSMAKSILSPSLLSPHTHFAFVKW